jgi:hypothetical protein
VSQAGAERLMAERASFASQVASMDAQLRAMHDLVKQLERARDAMSTQHEKERTLLERQVIRLVQGVRKCREQLVKRRDQVNRLKVNFEKFRENMLRQGGARATHGYDHASFLFLAGGGGVLGGGGMVHHQQRLLRGLMYQTPPGTPSRTALPQGVGGDIIGGGGIRGGGALPYSPSGMFYNPMTLQLSTPSSEPGAAAGGGGGRRHRRSGTPQSTRSTRSSANSTTNSPRRQSRREKRKRLRTRALLLPLLTTVQDLWGQLARCSFEVLMHSPKCHGMSPAEVLALSSKRLFSIERCVQSLLLATQGFSKSTSSSSKFTSSFDANGVEETPHKMRDVGASWSDSISSLLSLLPLSGKGATGQPSISVGRPMSPVRAASGLRIGRGRDTGKNVANELDDFVVPLFEQLVGQIYLFASEVVVLRRRVNDYTEALLSKAWEKEAQFQREFDDRVNIEASASGTDPGSESGRISSHTGSPHSGLVFGEDDEEDEGDEEDEDDAESVSEGREIREAGALSESSAGIVEATDAVLATISEEEFMDDDRADAILRELQVEASLSMRKKSSSNSEWHADTL